MGFYPPDALVHEAQRRGIEILPPDVNASEVGCTVVDAPGATAADGADAAVRLGLGYILGIRADEVAAIVASRRADGPFRSLDDLASRAGAGRPALAQLAWSGACDHLAGGRRSALWRLGIAAPAYGAGAGEGARQLALPLELPEAPALAPLGEWEAMIADYATTGLTIERHPLRLLRGGLRERGAVTSAELTSLPHESRVRIGGLVVARQRPGTAKGVVFLLLEDEDGTVNVIVPPPVYERDRLTVRTEPLVLVSGRLERHPAAGGAVNVLVDRVAPLDAPDLLAERPRREVEDVSPLDARQLARIAAERALAAEQELAAVAAGGGGGAFRAIAPPVMSFAQGRRR